MRGTSFEPNYEMKLRWSTLRVFVSSLLLGILIAHTPKVVTYAQATLKLFLPKQNSPQLSQEQLCQVAKGVTVKILGGDAWGSGVLISQRDSSKYSLITNGHVLKGEGEFFSIETPDGQKHSASLLVRFDHGQATGNDLAILQFDSPKSYQIATLKQWTEPDKVMAAGFPVAPEPSLADSQGFVCTQLGKVFRKLEQPMQQGYQLGYFISVRNGMSGGPLLDEKGRVVGINGMAEPAIFTNPDLYRYRDGTRVSESIDLAPERAMAFLSSSSWAIPSETIIYLSPEGLNLTLKDSTSSPLSAPLADVPSSPSSVVRSPSSELETLARQITVLVSRADDTNQEGNRSKSGSGVLVARNGNTYYFLTRGGGISDQTQYEVTTSTQRKYKIKFLEANSDLDLVIGKFTTNEEYRVATLKNSETIKGGSLVYVAGWMESKGMSSFTIVEGELVDAKALGLEGSLVYTNRVPNLIGGGAVIDQEGNLIGIHKQLLQEGGIREGIPISVFLEIAPKKVKDVLNLTTRDKRSVVMSKEAN